MRRRHRAKSTKSDRSPPTAISLYLRCTNDCVLAEPPPTAIPFLYATPPKNPSHRIIQGVSTNAHLSGSCLGVSAEQSFRKNSSE